MKKAIKLKVPKIQRDASGRRFVKIHGKRVFLSDNISERQLIKFIVGRLTKGKPVRRRVVKKKVTSQSEGQAEPLPPINYTRVDIDPKSADAIEERLRPGVAEQVLREQIKEKLKDRLRDNPDESSRSKPEEIQKAIKDAQSAQTDTQSLMDKQKVETRLETEKKSEITKARNKYLLATTKPDLLNEAKKANLNVNANLSKGMILAILEKHGVKDFTKEWEKAHQAKQPAKAQAGKGSADEDDRGLNTNQINQLMDKYPHFLGTIASDQIHNLKIQPKTEFGFVMNKDKLHMEGSHWVSVYSDGKGSIEYYDSFAKPPTQQFMKDVRWMADQLHAETYLKFKENKIIQQDSNSTNCGFFACKFLIDRFRNKPFAECTGYDDSVKGEKDIEAWKTKLHIEPFKYISGFEQDKSQDKSQDGEGLKEIYEGIRNGLVKGVKAVGRKLLMWQSPEVTG